MSLIEFIGFIVTLFAFVYLFFKRLYDQWRIRNYPEEVARERAAEGDRLKKFLSSLDDDMAEDDEEGERAYAPPAPLKKPAPQAVKKPPPQAVKKPPPQAVKKPAPQKAYQAYAPKKEDASVQADLDDRYSGKNVVSKYYLKYAKDHSYDMPTKEKDSRVALLLGRLKSKKEMVIIHEILSKPLSQRK